EALFAREKLYAQSRTARMVVDDEDDDDDDEHGEGRWSSGVTNYYLEIWPSSSSAPSLFGARRPTTPALILYFFDSRGGELFQPRPPSVDPPAP
nr:hypothetical protein [Tanacetum cinerariifolium]